LERVQDNKTLSFLVDRMSSFTVLSHWAVHE